MPKIRLTQTLISSYEWIFKKDDGYDDFLLTLNRVKKQPTEAMLLGTQYENCLNNYLLGAELPTDHEWYSPITEMADELWGSQQQVSLFRDLEINGNTYLIHGILDYLLAGEIFDCKFNKRYSLNKYFNSPQTSFYMYLVPEARRFTYLISDGKYVYRERYPRDIVEPIEPLVKNFIEFCNKQNLLKILEEHWSVN